MRHISLLISFSLFWATFSFSQAPVSSAKASLDGTIRDSSTFIPVEYALVSLHKVKDSSVVASIYTTDNGSFVLEDIPFGTYFLKVFSDGYKTKFIPKVELQPGKPLKKFGNIALISTSTVIGEVIIMADKNPLVTGIDKKVYNVGNDISVTGGSANDVLNNIPSVEIDQDGKVSLRGDGNVTILIDGKPSTLSGSNGKSLLDGIPAGSIERIEIVTNPSAKYDPDGTSGIINIVMKKNIKRGLNGNFQLSGATGNAYNASTGLSLRNTKINLYGTYAFDYKEGYRNNFSYLDQLADTNRYLDQLRKGTDLSSTHTAKIGMDLYLKDRNTLSWNVTGNVGLRERTGSQTNIRYTDFEDTTQFWNRVSSDPSHNQNIDASVAYHLDMKEDKGTIDWNGYQSMSKSDNLGYYTQDYTFPNAYSYTQNLGSYETNQITTLSMDVVRTFKQKWRTESGLKMIHRDQRVDSDLYTSDSTGNLQFDSIGYFNYHYLERIYSGYGIIASSYKKWKYQAGVRLEQSYQEPQLLSTGENYLNKYFNIFPSAHVRYEIAKKSEFSFGYSKRINRPNSESLNPFTSYADPYNLRRGNPGLTPEYIHSIDFGYERGGDKVTMSISAYQRFSNDVISRVKIFYPDGSSSATQANIDHSVSTGGELVFQYRPTTFWRTMFSTNANYIKYSSQSSTSANYNREGFVMSFKATSTFELMKKTLTIQLNGNYGLPSVTPTGIMRPRGSLNISADKSLKEGKWGVGLRVTDVFNTQGFRFYVDQPTAQQHVEFKWLTRRVYVSLRYRFGKVDLLDKAKGSTGAGSGGGGFDF